MTTAKLKSDWLRTATLFTSAHQQLEEELARMVDKKVNQEYIDKKDAQIQQLVDFYNQTDELIQLFSLVLTNMRVENHFLTEMLIKKCSIDDLMLYKPSRAAEIINIETGEKHSISTLNG